MRESVRIRPPTAIRAYGYAFLVVWFGVVLVGFIHSPNVALVFMLVAGIAVAYGSLRLGVDADESGLRVRNSFRTYRLAWSDIEDFRSGPYGGFPSGRVINAMLRNGDMLPLDVTKRLGLFPGSKRRLEAQHAALRSWLIGTGS